MTAAPQQIPAGSGDPHILEPAGPPALLADPPWPLEPDHVATWLGLDDLSPADTAVLELVATQASIYTERCRQDLWQATLEGGKVFVVDGEAYQGATMFAARQFRRRNTPSGLQHFGDAGVSYVSRWDADIDRALRTGPFLPPGLG